MIRAIIIDDEKHCIQTLEIELQRAWPDLKVIDHARNGKEGIDKIREHQPDLVFLDIEMPLMNGFEMLEQIGQIDFKVIFTTAYDQFAIKAFKFSAVDYLLKPVDREELKNAIARAMKQNENNVAQPQQFRHARQQMMGQDEFTTIYLPTAEGVEFVKVTDIIHCEADSSYSIVHLEDRKIVISKPLKYLESLLSEHPFIRCHQSFLVNRAFIKRYVRSEGGYLELVNGKQLPVSRSHRSDFLQLPNS